MTKFDECKAVVVIGGDFCPVGKQVLELCTEGNVEELFGDLQQCFYFADFSIINLEAPFVTKKAPIVKTGNNFSLHPNCINVLKKAKVKCLNLANNHILDHGESGFSETLEVCRKNGMQWLGVGGDLSEAGEPLIVSVNGLRLAFISMADHEFSLATDDGGGANPVDPIAFVRVVRRYRGCYERLIVLIHGGAEHYPYPSPQMQKLSRFVVEEGANAVVWQHSHCPGCIEWYQGTPIVYGQGNLIADSSQVSFKNLEWYKGFLVKLIVRSESIELIKVPYMRLYGQDGIRRMTEGELKDFNNEIEERSENILKKNFIANSWAKFCLSRKNTYMSILRGYGPFLKRVNARLNLVEKMYSKDDFAALLNVVRCQIHKEQLVTLLHLFTRNK